MQLTYQYLSCCISLSVKTLADQVSMTLSTYQRPRDTSIHVFSVRRLGAAMLPDDVLCSFHLTEGLGSVTSCVGILLLRLVVTVISYTLPHSHPHFAKTRQQARKFRKSVDVEMVWCSAVALR